MFIPRLYTPQPLDSDQTISLDKAASHYLSQVIRHSEKAPLILFNGTGGEYHGEVLEIGKHTTIQINHYDPITRTSPLTIELGQGLARGDRMDLIIQKATELGVQSIVPLKTEKSLVKLDAKRSDKRQQHWEKIAISACEQSGLNRLPIITPISTLAAWAAQPFEGLSIVLDPRASQTLESYACEPPKQVRLAIGSESGWSEKESGYLSQEGFIALRLGPRILRTETASLVMLSLLQGRWGDLK